jgi:hypothetical protein
MTSFFTSRSGKQKRMAKTQLVVLTTALLLALVILPVSADNGGASNGIDAGSARLAALGQYYTAQRLEASYAAGTSRYEALAGFYGQGNSVVVAQNAAELATNPELKSFSGSAAVASDFLVQNPELKYASNWSGGSAAAGSDFYAENPEAKYASGWEGSSAAVANSGEGSVNPELSAFEQYCGC